MELVLLVITVVSLIVAGLMAAATWRANRESRARSAARVAALAAAAEERPATSEPAMETIVTVETAKTRETSQRETIARPVAVNAWRAAPWNPPDRPGNDQPRPVDDRRASRAVDPREPADRQVSARSDAAEAELRSAFLGSAVAKPASGGRQRGLAIAACVLFAALVIGGYFTIYGDDASTASAAASQAEAAPLELISLRHERRNSRLAITGLVRNPAAGAPLEKLGAVVFLFNSEGAYLSNARADVDYTRLVPGDESPFVITLDAPPNVARYRVSFRNEAGVVPHIDRRGQEPIARELP
jgi:hypothetical protein